MQTTLSASQAGAAPPTVEPTGCCPPFDPAYTTCPACAKAYGKNYVIGFAKVRNAAKRE